MTSHLQIALTSDGKQKIHTYLETLRVDLGASGVLLLDPAGVPLVECGRVRGFDLDAYLSILGKAMAATNAVAHLLHDDAAFDLHFHEGQNFELYTTRLGDQVFLTLVLERGFGATSRMGMVWLTLRRAVTDLRALIKQSIAEPAKPVEDVPRPRTKLPGRGKPQPTVPPPVDLPKPESPASLDANSVLTYEEARKLGLINLDDLEAD